VTTDRRWMDDKIHHRIEGGVPEFGSVASFKGRQVCGRASVVRS
jgi:hypothetical protein